VLKKQKLMERLAQSPCSTLLRSNLDSDGTFLQPTSFENSFYAWFFAFRKPEEDVSYPKAGDAFFLGRSFGT